MYMQMASAHRYAIDYVEQAPVIVLAAAHGNAHLSRSERAFIQAQFRKTCQSKAQLRDVMRSYGLPLPLRLLDTRVLTARRATVIRRLALMNVDARADDPGDATETECLVAGPAKVVRRDGVPLGGT